MNKKSRVRAVDIIGTNLEGAKYTLAVPQNVYDAGVTSFADIAQYADEFDHLLMA